MTLGAIKETGAAHKVELLDLKNEWITFLRSFLVENNNVSQ